mmetsp:Transcript_12543/g.35611  ORF Transcript_12543/g.35611 Transcript_12543/m.35611 type:complete len:311 (+) Transcript_12543:3906-4838(+)
MAGNKNATVFPVPVLALPKTSLPAAAATNVLDWISVMWVKPISATAFLEFQCISILASSSNRISVWNVCSSLAEDDGWALGVFAFWITFCFGTAATGCFLAVSVVVFGRCVSSSVIPRSNHCKYSSFSVSTAAEETRCIRTSFNASGFLLSFVASFVNSVVASNPRMRRLVASENLYVAGVLFLVVEALSEAANPSGIVERLRKACDFANAVVANADDDGTERKSVVQAVMIKAVVAAIESNRILLLLELMSRKNTDRLTFIAFLLLRYVFQYQYFVQLWTFSFMKPMRCSSLTEPFYLVRAPERTWMGA